MQDAVILSNCIYDLESLSTPDINAALHDYRDQRYPFALEQYNASNTSAMIVFGHVSNEASRANMTDAYFNRMLLILVILTLRNGMKDFFDISF